MWGVTVNGKPIPIDAKARPDGNVDLVPDDDPREPPVAHMLDKHGARTVGHVTVRPSIRYVSHFATCPNADQHRKGDKPK